MMKKTKKKQKAFTENNYYFLPSPPPNDKKLVIENFQSSSAPVGRPPPVMDEDLLQDLASFISARELQTDQASPPPTPHFDTCQMDLDLLEFLDSDELASDAILFPDLPKN